MTANVLIPTTEAAEIVGPASFEERIAQPYEDVVAGLHAMDVAGVNECIDAVDDRLSPGLQGGALRLQTEYMPAIEAQRFVSRFRPDTLTAQTNLTTYRGYKGFTGESRSEAQVAVTEEPIVVSVGRPQGAYGPSEGLNGMHYAIRRLAGGQVEVTNLTVEGKARKILAALPLALPEQLLPGDRTAALALTEPRRAANEQHAIATRTFGFQPDQSVIELVTDEANNLPHFDLDPQDEESSHRGLTMRLNRDGTLSVKVSPDADGRAIPNRVSIYHGHDTAEEFSDVEPTNDPAPTLELSPLYYEGLSRQTVRATLSAVSERLRLRKIWHFLRVAAKWVIS